MLCVFNEKIKKSETLGELEFNQINYVDDDDDGMDDDEDCVDGNKKFKCNRKQNKTPYNNSYAKEQNEKIQIKMLTFQNSKIRIEAKCEWKEEEEEIIGEQHSAEKIELVHKAFIKERILNLIKFVANIKLNNMNNCSRIFLE